MSRILLGFTVFVLVLGLISVLAWLTVYEDDPCATSDSDVGAAILADDTGDQDALVYRAIMVNANCEESVSE